MSRPLAVEAVFRAYDKATGAEIRQTPLPGPQVSLPMTYLHNGRQFDAAVPSDSTAVSLCGPSRHAAACWRPAE